MLVVDPVMVAKGGDPLLQQSAVDAVKQHLLPLAARGHTEFAEAEVLVGHRRSTRRMQRARRRGRSPRSGPRCVVDQGRAPAGDADRPGLRRRAFAEFRAERIETANTHGTGCSFSAADCGVAGARAAASGGHRGCQDLVDGGDPGELSDRCWTFAGQPFPRGRPGAAQRPGRLREVPCRREGSGGQS